MMISSCWWVLLPDRQTDKQTDIQANKQADIGECRVAFSTENAISIKYLIVQICIFVWFWERKFKSGDIWVLSFHHLMYSWRVWKKVSLELKYWLVIGSSVRSKNWEMYTGWNFLKCEGPMLGIQRSFFTSLSRLWLCQDLIVILSDVCWH